MILNYEPRNVLQAQTIQSLPQRSIAIAQHESTPLNEPATAEPTQTFIHSPLPGQNSSPDVNFVEITGSANSTGAVDEFPESGESGQQIIEEPGTPSTGENTPFIELK